MIHSTKNDQYWLLIKLVPVKIKPPGSRGFFEKIGLQRLLRPVKLQRPNRSMRIEDGGVFMAWKITAKDFRII